MSADADKLSGLQARQEKASLHIRTLGAFAASVSGIALPDKAYGRETTIQLFQYLVTARGRQTLHREKIINRLWENTDQEEGERNFKVALHGLNKALEPNRKARTEAIYVKRQGISYFLNPDEVWIDSQAMEDYIAFANEAYITNQDLAAQAYKLALDLYQGSYLPDRIYEDWTSEERERLQVLALSGYMSLADYYLERQPLETVRLAQEALFIDATWEDAYALQMKAYLARGNRPGAIETYYKCIKVLDDEYGLDPLPTTQALFDGIV